MTPDQLKEARRKLGFSTAGLAKALRLGKQGARTVRRWEAGDSGIPGPAEVAIEMMLAAKGGANLDELTSEDIERGAKIFAQISYREREFGRSTDIRFPHDDDQTILHFEMAVEAMKALAAGKAWQDLDIDAPYFVEPENGESSG